eukprot:1319859-Amorphochlora_amoeboformis.AAC.1
MDLREQLSSHYRVRIAVVPLGSKPEACRDYIDEIKRNSVSGTGRCSLFSNGRQRNALLARVGTGERMGYSLRREHAGDPFDILVCTVMFPGLTLQSLEKPQD